MRRGRGGVVCCGSCCCSCNDCRVRCRRGADDACGPSRDVPIDGDRVRRKGGRGSRSGRRSAESSSSSSGRSSSGSSSSSSSAGPCFPLDDDRAHDRGLCRPGRELALLQLDGRRSCGSGRSNSASSRRGSNAAARACACARSLLLLLSLKPRQRVGLGAQPARQPQARQLALPGNTAEALVPALHPGELRQAPPGAARGNPSGVDRRPRSAGGPAAFPCQGALVGGVEELLAGERGAEGSDGVGREVLLLLFVEEAVGGWLVEGGREKEREQERVSEKERKHRRREKDVFSFSFRFLKPIINDNNNTRRRTVRRP